MQYKEYQCPECEYICVEIEMVKNDPMDEPSKLCCPLCEAWYRTLDDWIEFKDEY